MSGEKIYRKPSRSAEYGKGGPSRSRQLGVFVLVLALFIFQVTIFICDKLSQKGESPVVALSEPFCFDPNTISPDSLCMLGLSQRQAQSILNYRSKGGRFRKPEDFSRMYVVSEEMFLRLRPFIVIPSEDLGTKQGANVPKLEKSERLGTKRAQNVPKLEKSGSKGTKLMVVELNEADSAKLVTLYGIGPFYAKRIIQYRERLGGFHSPEQLMEIPGIDSTRFGGLARRVTADPLKIRRFRLDTAGRELLVNHPYIGAYAARGIILMREKLGKESCTLENLVRERVISNENAERLWPYIE